MLFQTVNVRVDCSYVLKHIITFGGFPLPHFTSSPLVYLSSSQEHTRMRGIRDADERGSMRKQKKVQPGSLHPLLASTHANSRVCNQGEGMVCAIVHEGHGTF